MIEQHASECKDLLLSELCELRRQVASQQPSALFPAPLTEAPQTMNISDISQHPEQNGHPPLLMTPPSTGLPSSDHETGGHDPFGATVIRGDQFPHERSSSILNLDVEGSLDNLQMEDDAKDYGSDEDMEDGELGDLEEDSTLIVETAASDEEEQANEDASAENDVLRAVGIKTELVEESHIADSTHVINSSKRISPHQTQQAASKQSQSDGPAGVMAKLVVTSLKRGPKPQAPSSTKKVSSKQKASTRPMPGTATNTIHAVSTGNLSAVRGSPAVLGYGYMEENGHIVSVSPDYHDLVRANPPEPAHAFQNEKIARNSPHQAMSTADTFGPIRNTMHRRSDAISHGKGPHPYANTSRYPRLVPPPPGYAGPNPNAPSWYLPPNPAHHGVYTNHGTYPPLNQHPSQRSQGGPAGYQGLTQNLPPRPHWAPPPYDRGHANHGIPHSRGYPSQMHPDFDSEGFEGLFDYFPIY